MLDACNLYNNIHQLYPMDYTVHGILQAILLEWVAVPFSKGCSLLQGIFPTLGSNPGFPHSRWIVYHLSYQGSPGTLWGVAYTFFSRSLQLRNQNRVSCIAGGFSISWATREAPYGNYKWNITFKMCESPINWILVMYTVLYVKCILLNE